MYAVVNNEEEQHSLQNDINNRVHWSDKWLLKFNKSKCKHVHLRHATNTKHKMGENEINQVTEENDIGILIVDKLKLLLIMPSLWLALFCLLVEMLLKFQLIVNKYS